MVEVCEDVGPFGHYREKLPIVIGDVDSKQARRDDQLASEIMELSVSGFLGQLVSQLAAFREERRQKAQQDFLRQNPYRPLVIRIRQIMHSFPIF